MGNKHGTRYRGASRDQGRAKGGESSVSVGGARARAGSSDKARRLSKTESLSDPTYIKEQEEWMRNNNPYAADLESDRLFVRGVRKVEVDDLDSLFSTDKSLYVDTSASPGTLQRRQYTTDADLGEDIVDELSPQPKSSAENTDRGSTEKILEWDEPLHSKNSRLFRKTDEIYAFCTNDPCMFQKDWGQCEAKSGDWVIVGKHLNSKDASQSLSNGVDRAILRNVYSITNDEFRASYVAVSGRPNMYIKRKPVRARRMSHKFVLKRAVEDQISVGDVGDYVVQSTARQYIVRAAKFDQEYKLARSKYTGQLTGSTGPSRLQSFSSGLKYPEWGMIHESVSFESLESLSLYEDNVIGVLNEEMFRWGCDVFKIAEITKQWPLFYMGWHLIHSHYGLCEKLNINEAQFLQFLLEVDDAYLPNPYHNNLHGADVMTSSHYIIKKTGFLNQMNDLELFSLLIAGLVHDIAHPGTSNSFQVNAQSAIAIRYNDHSVLENFHAATTFEILSGEKFYGMFPKEVEVEIFNKNNDKELVKLNFRGTFRKYIIALVLATDLAAEVANPILLRFREKTKAFKLHGADNKDILARKSALNFRDSSDRLLCLKMTIKCSDIAHGAKPLELHKRWSSLVTEEFLSQSEKEKDLRLPHAFVVSRDPKKYAKSQAGFIRFVVLKCYTDFCNFVGDAGDEFRRNIKSNISYWNESKRAILASERLQEMNENKLQTSSRQQMSLSEYSELPSHTAFTGTVFRNRVKSRDRRNTNNLKKNGTVSMQHIVVEAEVENGDADGNAEGKHQKRRTGTRRFVSSEELLKD